MQAGRVVLVAGASGAAGTRIAELLGATEGFSVLRLARRTPAEPGWVEADLSDGARLASALARHPEVTDLVYAARAPFGEGGVEDVAGNLAMLRNLLDAAEAGCPGLLHVHLVQGGKWYGLHLGPFPTPAREDDPRHLPPNFYYDQQDLVEARARARGWSWSASRPHMLCDVAPGQPRNLVSTLGAYAAICRELGVPLDFPGRPGAHAALADLTEASQLARAVRWMMTTPSCASQSFNVTNGDPFRWSDLWRRLAGAFDMPVGVVRPVTLARWMADKDPVWECIARRHGLRLPLGQVASWAFADFVLGQDYDVLLSMTKSRLHGFHDVVDTAGMLARQVEAYRKERILP